MLVGREQPSFPAMGLRKPSVFRCHKLALLHKTLVLRKLGDIDPALMRQAEQRLRIALGLSE